MVNLAGVLCQALKKKKKVAFKASVQILISPALM